MATFGLGDYKYDITVDNGSKFHFYDPEDANNTADVTVAKSDYPDGVVDGDARQIADIAYALVSKQLNDKRDVRIKREATAELDKQLDQDATRREAVAEFLSNAKEIGETDSSLNVEESSSESTETEAKKK